MSIRIRNLFKLNWKFRSYQIWVINTTKECHLYLWDGWHLIMPSIDILLKLTQEQSYIRTFQSFEYENRWLGFGRMKWNEENNIKWTTKYRKNNLEKQPEFFNTEIWAPDWNTVCKTGMPPDIFVSLYNYPGINEIREGFIIALPNSLYKGNKKIVDDLLIQIASHIPYSEIHETKRDWWGRTASRNNIEDLTPQEIKKIIG